ncbi:MAG: methyltransferase [Clostridia bacterium]
MENERIDDLGIKNLKVVQNPDYFCFGTDSVLLANFVKSTKSANVIVDLCAGSSVIPLIMSAKIKCSRIFAVELQKEMFELSKKSIALNKLKNKIIPIHKDIKDIKAIREALLTEGYPEVVDIITVNPPYKKEGTGIKNDTSVKTIARHEIKCTLEDIFSTSKKLLKDLGKLYMVHKPERLAEIIYTAKSYGFEAKRIRLVEPKKGMKASIALFEFVKFGNPEVIIEPTLIEYNEDGTYTDEIYKIYGMERKIEDEK